METEAKPFISFEETLRQRQRELLTFRRDVVAPLLAEAQARVNIARPPAFDTGRVPVTMAQRVITALAAVNAATQAMLAEAVTRAIGEWEEAHMAMFRRFTTEQRKWTCPECAHWGLGCLHRPALAGGDGAEMLYATGGWTRPTE